MLGLTDIIDEMTHMIDCQAWEQAIRTGRFADVRKALKLLNFSKLPRKLSQPVANLARRCGLYSISLRILSPIVTLERNYRQATPRPDELAEYGMALVNIGAVSEGRGILESISSKDVPHLPLLLAQAYIPEWKYGDAIRVLEPLQHHDHLDSYLKLVAQVNLSAAYVYNQRLSQADELIAECLQSASQQGFILLQGNLLEIKSQMLLEQRRFSEARKVIATAKEFLSHTGTTDELYVHKWSRLLDLYERPKSKEATRALREVYQQALVLRHWETLRDLDRHLAITQRDTQLFHHLYYGSPYEEYRNRLRGQLSDLPEPPAHYIWRLRGEKATRGAATRGAATLDMRTLQLDGTELNMKHGFLLHRLLTILSTDFYRPLRTGSLFSRLFPGEFYNHIMAPNRVHQIVKRLNALFSENSISLVVEEQHGAYRLSTPAALDMILSRDSAKDGGSDLNFKLESQLSRLERLTEGRIFTAKQAAALLEVSLSTATRLLRVAARDPTRGGFVAALTNQLEIVGHGPKTSFRFLHGPSRFLHGPNTATAGKKKQAA
ncbi:MAG: hypothetical protein C5B49_10720 [Bdellovibrio sp.]|nr:MAG: hypothetical protein C5B49_10720 [Bdellovibrio sp.]